MSIQFASGWPPSATALFSAPAPKFGYPRPCSVFGGPRISRPGPGSRRRALIETSAAVGGNLPVERLRALVLGSRDERERVIPDVA
jgi:hypothetical protein